MFLRSSQYVFPALDAASRNPGRFFRTRARSPAYPFRAAFPYRRHRKNIDVYKRQYTYLPFSCSSTSIITSSIRFSASPDKLPALAPFVGSAGCGRLTVRRTSVPSCLATPSSGDIFVQAAKNKTDSHAITGSRKREPRSSGTGSSLSLFPYLLIVSRLSLPNIPLVYFIPWGDFRINGQAPALIQID